jgi:hypothetical protein
MSPLDLSQHKMRHWQETGHQYGGYSASGDRVPMGRGLAPHHMHEIRGLSI